jgi:hypothetical protein
MGTEQCVRCAREIRIDAGEFSGSEFSGGGFVCATCVTRAEHQAVDQGDTDLAAALDAHDDRGRFDAQTAGDIEHKVRENRLRRVAERQGLRLEKSRRRDKRAWDWGTYQLVDASTSTAVAYGSTHGYGLNLDEIEAALSK